MYLKKPSK